MTDRLDMEKLIKDCRDNIIAATPSVIIRSCLDDQYQNNIKYLEDNDCSVAQLKAIIKGQVEDSNSTLLDFGGRLLGPTATGDFNLAFQFIADYGKSSPHPPTFEELLDFMVKENSKNPDMFDEVMFALQKSGYNPQKVAENNKYKNINKYCTDLVIKAKNNRLDPLIGREKEVERMIEILAHYNKSNPLLVGEAGVGKTQIVEGLASAIAQDRVPSAIKGAKIFTTSIARLLAGSKFRGDVEEKVGQLIDELKRHKEETKLPTYLFIDETHQIVGAGGTSGNGNDGSNIANIIKPELASGELSLIGATTSKEYKRTIQKDDALNRRFQVLRVEEPNDEETIEILRKGIAPVLTAYHGVKYTKPVIEKAVKLSSKYITDKAQPDKSISILDSVGARLRTTESRDAAKISDVEKLISTITGTPITAFKEGLKGSEYIDIESKLRELVFGQNEAIKKVSNIYERSKAGLNEECQPIGSILAIGPTGVGKTALAIELASITDSHFFKINMGEYTEQHSVAKLFGSPPGYVGHKDGGLLTNEIRKNPHTVLLLDEIEKAHSKVFEALLGIIDGGKMTDGEGVEVDFSNVFIIMTSNVGAALAASRNIINLAGDSSIQIKAKNQVSEAALKSTFSPEFRNKLTAIVNFNSLSKAEIRLVTNKFLKSAKDKLKVRKGINLEFTEAVYEFISKKGFDPQFGARPIKKLIDTSIVDVLVKPILKGEVMKGDTITFDIQDRNVVYSKLEVETVEI